MQFKELMENIEKVICKMIIIDICTENFPKSKKTLEFRLTGSRASDIIRTVTWKAVGSHAFAITSRNKNLSRR